MRMNSLRFILCLGCCNAFSVNTSFTDDLPVLASCNMEGKGKLLLVAVHEGPEGGVEV